MKMNKQLLIGLFSSVAFFLLFSTSAYSQGVEALKGKRILYVYGGWDGHEPKQCRDIFVPWLKSAGAEVIEYEI